MVQDVFHQHAQLFSNNYFSNKGLGSLYIANPNNASLWGKSLKITIDLHQVWSPQHGPHVVNPSEIGSYSPFIFSTVCLLLTPNFVFLPQLLGSVCFRRKSTGWLHRKGLKFFQGDEGRILSLIHILQTLWKHNVEEEQATNKLGGGLGKKEAMSDLPWSAQVVDS